MMGQKIYNVMWCDPEWDQIGCSAYLSLEKAELFFWQEMYSLLSNTLEDEVDMVKKLYIENDIDAMIDLLSKYDVVYCIEESMIYDATNSGHECQKTFEEWDRLKVLR